MNADASNYHATKRPRISYVYRFTQASYHAVLTMHSAQGAKFAKIFAGKDKTAFEVHEDLLVYHSSFFRAALTGAFKEAGTKEVVLEVDNVRTVEFFAHWLYYGRFPDKNDAEDLHNLWCGNKDYDHDAWEKKTNNLIYLYVFADKYDVRRLCHQVMDEIYRHINDDNAKTSLPNDDMTSYAFNNLATESPLCCFLVDAYCFWAHEVVWGRFEEYDYPTVFLGKVLLQYGQLSWGERDPYDGLDACNYHQHKDAGERELRARRDGQTGSDLLMKWQQDMMRRMSGSS